MIGAMPNNAKDLPGSLWPIVPPALFATLITSQLILFSWPWRYALSGAPLLTFTLLLGGAYGQRILPFIHGWTLFTTINLAYSVASTSWLLYWVFAAVCYPAVIVTAVFQFRLAAHAARWTMRALIKRAHFIDDKIALFDLPALEIDTHVMGLLVFRGVTISLSTLTAVVHEAQVGIKFSDDMELAIQTEMVKVSLFRKVEVGDIYVNLKGGNFEMTFGDRNIKPQVTNHVEDVFSTNTPILRAATGEEHRGAAKLARISSHLKEDVTHGNPPEDASAKSVAKEMHKFSFRGDPGREYTKRLQNIQDTSSIVQAREHIQRVEAHIKKEEHKDILDSNTTDHDYALRAAICSRLHSRPSVPNPPKQSIKVTTIRKLSSPRVKRLLHRLPLLLRLLLNPIAYLHPVTIASITGTTSGRWMETALVGKIFKGYGDGDPDLQAFKRRVSAWLSGANFAVQLGAMSGTAQVPVNPAHDIRCAMNFKDVLAYRASPEEISLRQVIKLKGTDATFGVPSFLLPHHEHLVPEKPVERKGSDASTHSTDSLMSSERKSISSGRKSISKGRRSMSKERKAKEKKNEDTAKVKMSIHAHLPVTLDQDLIDFIAILAKASKLVELEQQISSSSSSSGEDEGEVEPEHKIGHLAGVINKRFKIGMKKALIANDKWLARQVGKIMGKLQQVGGDVGYTGDIPVKLAKYRETGWLEGEGEKILP